MILHPLDGGLVAIPQSAHAMVSFQLADHWGNRRVPRPSPRPDVLAAVLLHDAGWDDREQLRLGPDGRPLAFDTLPEDEREPLWRAAVERAASRGRYVEYLVSHHVSHLADAYSSTPHPEFLAAEEERRAAIRRDLEADPRYRQVFATSADAANRALLRLADAIAVLLGVGMKKPVTFADLELRTGPAPLELSPVRERTYRLRPWPLVGSRLVVHAEGRQLPRERFATDSELAAAWREAAVVRLSWTLLAPAAD
jgi:hypothetical protein